MPWGRAGTARGAAEGLTPDPGAAPVVLGPAASPRAAALSPAPSQRQFLPKSVWGL